MSWFLTFPYSWPQVVQTAFWVQVAFPPVWSLIFLLQISQKWSLLSSLCWQTYSHSLQTPSFHSCASSATVTTPQLLHFFLCVFAVWVHSSASVCLQIYPHTLHFPFSHSCKAHPSCACGSSFTGHASSVHWCQWYVALFDQTVSGQCSWNFTLFNSASLPLPIFFLISFHCSAVPR